MLRPDGDSYEVDGCYELRSSSAGSAGIHWRLLKKAWWKQGARIRARTRGDPRSHGICGQGMTPEQGFSAAAV